MKKKDLFREGNHLVIGKPRPLADHVLAAHETPKPSQAKDCGVVILTEEEIIKNAKTLVKEVLGDDVSLSDAFERVKEREFLGTIFESEMRSYAFLLSISMVKERDKEKE